MNPIRRARAETDAAAPSDFAKLLEVEHRLAGDIQSARRRAEALVETVRMAVREREARLTRALADGFPDLEARVAAERQGRIEALIADAREQKRRLEAIDAEIVDHLAADVIDRLLGHA